MYFISAPFGNYLKFKDAISVTGSWTLTPRPGRFKQILTTLRFSSTGWINRIGLRNPGIEVGIRKHKHNEVLSVAPVEYSDNLKLHRLVPKNISVEINISCPNIKELVNDDYCLDDISLWTKDKREWCICKIPPIFPEYKIDHIINQGYTQIHASNTIPTDKVGLSGRAIIPHTLRILKYIKTKYPSVTVIAGGGIYSKDEINMYKDSGADHFSLGTICFTPWKIPSILRGNN